MLMFRLFEFLLVSFAANVYIIDKRQQIEEHGNGNNLNAK